MLKEISGGNPMAAEKLLPLVYEELRKLAAAKLYHEQPGQTLQATDLVHEAYLRLEKGAVSWKSPGHFYGAAALAIMAEVVAERHGASGGPMSPPREVV